MSGRSRVVRYAATTTAVAIAAAVTALPAQAGTASGGTQYAPPPPPGPTPAGLSTVPGRTARVLRSGLAAAPANAPAQVKAVIASGNQIAKLPYRWGGGHQTWFDTGYDCSGSTTYALRTTFRRGPYPTFGYDRWGLPGPGQWITVYSSGWHVFLVVAGLRFDTSGLHTGGTRWQVPMRSTRGFTAHHPAGF